MSKYLVRALGSTPESMMSSGFVGLLNSVMGADLWSEGLKTTYTTGESLVFGDLCYFNLDGYVYKADANGIGKYPAVVMALGTVGAGVPCFFLMQGIVRNDAWSWTVGDLLYLSATPGEITDTPPGDPGDVVQVVGIAFPNSDTVYFNPQLVWTTNTTTTTTTTSTTTSTTSTTSSSSTSTSSSTSSTTTTT
jgi:hypothetical protein